MKCKISDAGDALRDRDASQTATAPKCLRSDAGDTSWNHNIDARIFCPDPTITFCSIIVGQQLWFKFITAIKCRFFDSGDTLRNRNASQTATALKCLRIDSGDTFRNRDASQTATVIKCIFSDAGDIIHFAINPYF